MAERRTISTDTQVDLLGQAVLFVCFGDACAGIQYTCWTDSKLE